MSAAIRVAILGATGYGAGELLRLLAQHPSAEVVALTTTSQPGARVGDVHPHLRGFYDHLRLERELDLARLRGRGPAIVFSALPHGASATALESLLSIAEAERTVEGELRVIDLSGDFRLQEEDLHTAHYPETPWLAARRAQFTYGLPELFRPAVRNARHIANPGCLASGAILAVAPLAVDLRGPLALDAKTGSSGSGRQLRETTHHPTRHADFRAYKVLAHQHEPEIRQALGDARGTRVETSFVAQSLPVSRGIFVTAHATLAAPTTTAELRARYTDFYAESPFVRVVTDSPTLQDVVGSNFCDVSVTVRGRQVVALAALDNLVKGMAGVAVQNMNLLCGLSECTGLWSAALRPV